MAASSYLFGCSFEFKLQDGESGSKVYKWDDMKVAADEMCNVGVAGSHLYAGLRSDTASAAYGLANVAAFLANSMQETIQYDACDENNWSDAETQAKTGGAVYPATAACGQLGQSYQDYKCKEMKDPETGRAIDPEDLQCEVDPGMEAIGETHATWYAAPPPLFCAPKSKVPKAPKWNFVSPWCPPKGSWGHKEAFNFTAGMNLDPYWEYVSGSTSAGGSCRDYDDVKTGGWDFQDCGNSGCANTDADHSKQGEPRTDVEGCCWWGRGVIQTTGVCNFGKLNYFLGAKAAKRGKAALFPTVDFCRDPGAICRADHPELKWVAGFFYWLESVQSYDVRGGNYMRTLTEWIANGADLDDHTLIDFTSGVVNRGCWDAPTTDSQPDPCGNGPVHGLDKRRAHFAQVVNAFKASGVWPTPGSHPAPSPPPAAPASLVPSPPAPSNPAPSPPPSPLPPPPSNPASPSSPSPSPSNPTPQPPSPSAPPLPTPTSPASSPLPPSEPAASPSLPPPPLQPIPKQECGSCGCDQCKPTAKFASATGFAKYCSSPLHKACSADTTAYGFMCECKAGPTPPHSVPPSAPPSSSSTPPPPAQPQPKPPTDCTVRNWYQCGTSKNDAQEIDHGCCADLASECKGTEWWKTCQPR